MSVTGATGDIPFMDKMLSDFRYRTQSRIIGISVADPDPFGSVSFWSAGSGSASMKLIRIRIRVAKNQPKSWKISTKINLNH